MADTVGAPDSELRQLIDQQITALETAIAISTQAAKEDAPAPDGEEPSKTLTPKDWRKCLILLVPLAEFACAALT